MAEMLLVNPRKRRKAKKRRTTKRRKNPIRKVGSRAGTAMRAGGRRVTRRRNPAARRAKGVMGIIKMSVIPSATAAGGALALDAAWGMLPIPENLKTGPIRHVAKGVGAIGIGMLAGMFTNRATANLITTGAMTVVMHNAGKELLSRVAPNLALGMYDDEDLGYAGAGQNAGYYDDDLLQNGEPMGEYELGDYDEELGEYEELDM